MSKLITTDIVVAYSQCPHKAYLLLYTQQKGEPHDYTQILEAQKVTNQAQYVDGLKQKQVDLQSYAEKGLKSRADFLLDAILQADGLQADSSLLIKAKGSSRLGRYHYEPILFTGTHTVTKEQRLQMHFVGHVLAKVQKKQPAVGKLIRMGGGSTKVKLEESDKTLLPLLEPLQEETTPEEPLVILNKHCALCQFRAACRTKADQEDNLSLLDRVTPKIIKSVPMPTPSATATAFSLVMKHRMAKCT